MALDTVADYVARARVLLNDSIAPYRYPDADLVEALNSAVLEARRIRPELFLRTFSSLPDFSAVDTTEVDIDQQVRMAFLYYIVGQAQLRDNEGEQDTRASAFLNKFIAQLITPTA